MVRVLLLGDLHLSTTGASVPSACPDLDTLDVDAVVSIGDVIDDNADHAADRSAGDAYEKRGRAFFERLNAMGVPGFVVPGNHDPSETTRRLTDGFENLHLLHRRRLGGEATGERALEGLSFAGWGCEQFDLTPAFEYDRYPGIVPVSADIERVAQTADRIAADVEAAIGPFLAGESSAKAAAEELGISPEARTDCIEELLALEREFDRIRELLGGDAGTTVVLSHESPFNVEFDHHHSTDALRRRLHHGSIPLKMAISATAPDVVLCGHTHSRGRDVIETVGGYADVYNPGSPGIAVVEIDAAAGALWVRQ